MTKYTLKVVDEFRIAVNATTDCGQEFLSVALICDYKSDNPYMILNDNGLGLRGVNRILLDFINWQANNHIQSKWLGDEGPSTDTCQIP